MSFEILEIWWIGTSHPNLVSIHLTVSEKTMSAGERPRHDSSSAVQYKAELKMLFL